jgi:hypothetical protein
MTRVKGFRYRDLRHAMRLRCGPSITIVDGAVNSRPSAASPHMPCTTMDTATVVNVSALSAIVHSSYSSVDHERCA